MRERGASGSRLHRVASCMWWVARDARGAEVWYSPGKSRARYRRLMVCGSVWACPVCAERIAGFRADEIRRALARNDELGGSAGFATFTVSHKHEDALGVVLDGFLAAYRRLTGSEAYRAVCDRWGVRGVIRVLEVTYGRNGWHPHAHALPLFRRRLADGDYARFEDEVYPLWERSAARSGLHMNRRYGLEVKRAYGTVEGYLQKFGRLPKWDAAGEIARGHVKRGRLVAGLKHLTPFELLAAATAGDDRSGRLFRTFVERFDGKAQLFWSPLLKAELLDVDKAPTDEQLAGLGEDDELLAGTIERQLWWSVKQAGGRERVLQLVEDAGGEWGAVADYLALVGATYPYVQTEAAARAAAWVKQDERE